MPYPPLDGGSQLINNCTEGLLQNGVSVKVFALNTTRIPVDENLISENYRTRTGLTTVTIDTKIKFQAAATNFLFNKESYFISRFYSEKVKLSLQKLLKSESFDIIQLEHLYMCLYIDVIRSYSNAKIILRPQNVEHHVWQQYGDKLKNIFKRIFIRINTARLKNYESSIIKKLDAVIPVSDTDQDFFNSLNTGIPIKRINMGFNFNSIQDYNFETQYKYFPKAYHLASMDWLPNSEGVDWFLSNIYPALRREIPEVQFYMAGRNMPQHLYQLQSSSLNIEGEITQPLKYQEDKAIMIVPLLTASGTRAKIIEGMALGKTIISTSIGALGVLCTDGENILIADTTEEFVIQLKKCTSIEFCRKIGANARQHAFNEYDYISCGRKFIELYTELLNPTRGK